MKRRNINGRKFSFSEQYSKSWAYIKSSRNYIFTAIILFFVFAILGYFIRVPEELSNLILQYIQELLVKTEGLGAWGLISFVFFNNVQSGLFSFIFGALFGIFPVIIAIFNGFILGFVSNMAVQKGGISVLLDLLPHGVFELPAIFISLGMGLRFGSFLFRKNPAENFRIYFWEGLRVFIFVVIPLLIVAAIIEGSLISIGG